MILPLPDNLLVELIQPRNAHADLKSHELSTGKVGKKYKLAGHIINITPTIYPFFIVTKNQFSCQSSLTVCIKQTDWEERDHKHLTLECSFVDIKKVEPLTKEEVIEKLKDTGNEFACVAKLKQSKFDEFKEKLGNLRHASCSERQSAIIRCAIEETDLAEMLYRKLLG